MSKLRLALALFAACVLVAAALAWYRTGGWLTVAHWRTADAAEATRYDLSEEAYEYLNRALVAMQRVSLRRDEVDWPALRQAALAEARGAETPGDTYAAIRLALERLGDNHSFLLTPDRVAAMGFSGGATGTDGEPVSVRTPAGPSGRLVRLRGDRLGYVRLPGVMGRGEDTYADTLRATLGRLARRDPCGWIVDLRANQGGNMWPMLAGLGPVIGPGRIGASVQPDGDRQPWYYEDGAAGLLFLGGWLPLPASSSDRPPERLEPPYPPVAVLTDSLTASSGEAVAVAFRGRPNARSFGWPTTGVSSANRTVFLPDGARLYVTASVYADRTGRTYGGSLVPDVMIEDVMAADTTTASGADALHGDAARRPYAAARDTLPATTLDPPHDPAALRLFDAATAWLAAHPACDTTATAPTAFVPVTFTSAPPASMSDTDASTAAAPSASSVLGLRTTIYTVPDLEAAKAWYAQAFGVAPYFDEPFYVGFDVGGYELGLSPAEDGKRPGGTGVVAYWGVDDVEAAHAHFLEHGAAPREDVMDVGDGVRVAVVADPYGNLIGLIENPHFGK